MQPYFFPYIGYFQLIKSVDRFIFFDDVQYIRHGWINRNRILKPGEGWQYIIAPLQKHSQGELIKNINLADGTEWRERIIRQLEHYKKKARYYNVAIELVKSCFDLRDSKMAQFNAGCIETICKYLGISLKVEMSSKMNFDYANIESPGEWAFKICEQINAKEYINPLGGKELFDKTKFQSSGMKLSFISPVIVPYDQRRGEFESGLSIIDVLMFNGPEATRSMIDNLEIECD